MFIVYRAWGSMDSQAYYGYSKEQDDPKQKFLQAAKRSEDRGDIRLLNLNNNDADLITVDVLDIVDDELEAWAKRNDYRSSEIDSITGPTQFPCGMAERAAKELPNERIHDWKKNTEINKAKTARQAWSLGKWTNDTIKGLTLQHNKPRLIKDLDSLTPLQFHNKYFC